MKNGIKMIVIGIFICCTLSYAQDTGIDCAQLFDECVKEKNLSVAADRFINLYNDADSIVFLHSKIEDPNSSKLAMISLAKLAVNKQSARDILYDSIYTKNGQGIEAIGYLEPVACRTLVEPLLERQDNVEVRKDATEILGAVGDVGTLNVLEALRLSEKSRMVQRAINSAIEILQYKVTNVPLEEQKKWSQEDLMLWRTLKETPDISRSGVAVYGKAAMAIKEQGKQISRNLLEYKVASGDLMGIALVGAQRETWAVRQLESFATRGDSVGDFSRTALMNIGTLEAIAALQNSLLPNGSNRANVNIIMMLSLMGGHDSADYLDKLAQDEEFSEKDRRRMTTAVRMIKQRLSRQ